MEPFLDEECVFLSVGQVFYRLSKNRAISMSSFLRWCLNSGQRSEFVHWISLGDKLKRRLFIVRLGGKAVDEVTLTQVAHYLQTEQLVGLNAYNVAEILKVGHMLGVTVLTRICSEFLRRLAGQLPVRSLAETTVLRRAVSIPEQFPNKTFLVALMMKYKVMESNRNWFWDVGEQPEDIIERKFLGHAFVPWPQKDIGKSKSLFIDLGTEVAPENYVYDDSEIMYLMEATSVHKGHDAVDGIGLFGGKLDAVPGSPRTLPEEWRLSPAKSVDLDQEFGDMDREFLHDIYDDY